MLIRPSQATISTFAQMEADFARIKSSLAGATTPEQLAKAGEALRRRFIPQKQVKPPGTPFADSRK